MKRFTIRDTPIQGVKVVERVPIGDERGFLTRLFCADELRTAGWVASISQINHTYTKKRRTVRGIHFQHPPYAEMKLVTCVRGAIFDVAVDLRSGSATFLQWYGTELSDTNQQALLIPEGCGHAFQTLSKDVEIIYLHSRSYNREAEGALNLRDPRIEIDWPLSIGDTSERDASHPFVDDNYEGIQL